MVVAVQRTALSGMHRFLNVCVVEYSPLPRGMVTKTVPASKIKGQCAGNTPTTANILILADTPILPITTHLG